MVSRRYVLTMLMMVVVGTVGLKTTAQHSSRVYHRQRGETQVGQLTHDLDSSVQSIQDTLKAIQNGISIQNGNPSVISSTKIPELDFSKQSCLALSQSQRNSLTATTNNVIPQLAMAQTEAEKQTVTSASLKTKVDIHNQLLYSETLNDQLNSGCKYSIDITPTTYQTYIHKTNWILGNLNFADVVKQYVERAKKHPNVTNCPQNQPFFTGSECIQCDDVFDISTSTCTRCPTGKAYNETSKDCSKTVIVPASTPNATSPSAASNVLVPKAGALLGTASPNDVSCPETTPYYNGSACIECKAPKYIFNTTSKACTQCESGQTFNSTTHLCQSPPVIPNTVVPPTPNATNLNAATGILAPNATNLTAATGILAPNASSIGSLGPNDVACPTGTPYFNGTKCIACTAPNNIFNTTSKTCTACPAGEQYNAKTYKCQKIPPAAPNATNPVATNKLVTPSPTSPLGVADSKHPNAIPCPTTTPFFNGTQCIACVAPKTLFNTTSLTCTACPTGTELNSTNQCSPLAPNATNPNSFDKVVAKNPSDVTSPVNGVPCPTSNPFFNGTACIACSDPKPLFNLSTNTCTQCPTGQIFISSKHSCEPPTPNATNPSGYPNVQTANTASLTPEKTDVPCPTKTPYFNGKQCIACDPPIPLFKADTKVCSACQTGLVYNTATHQCTVVPNATNPANFPNVITPNSTVILQSHPNDVNCPASAPYYNGKTCIACSAPTPLFSLVTLNCAACEAPKVYNSLAHQCELTNNNYVTNPNAQNLLNDGLPTNYWNQQSTTAMAAIPAPKVCPTQTPYYNGQKCITCSSPTPYFNLGSHNCESCPANTAYDQASRECVSSGSTEVNPSLKGMSGTVFSHRVRRHQLKQ